MTEQTNSKSIIIIGAGIAGLSTGVYAQLNGVNSRVYEMQFQTAADCPPAS